MDQSATTQAYVSGMKEALSLNGNELVEFTTYFSIGYALGIVPAQVIQTMVCHSSIWCCGCVFTYTLAVAALHLPACLRDNLGSPHLGVSLVASQSFTKQRVTWDRRTYRSKNAQTVYAIRFFLGIFESVGTPIAPGINARKADTNDFRHHGLASSL